MAGTHRALPRLKICWQCGREQTGLLPSQARRPQQHNVTLHSLHAWPLCGCLRQQQPLPFLRAEGTGVWGASSV